MEKIEPKITIMVDIDDCLWGLVEHWIDDYKVFMKDYDYLAYNAHDKHLNKSMITSWDIISCLKPTDTDMFWNVLDSPDFWRDMAVDTNTVNALKVINDNPNIDLIICTDTYYKSATPKLTRFFELFPFIKPSQVICAKEKWRINADIVIDDKPETLERFMLKYKPPFAVVKISQPWNATTICDYTWNEFDNGLARFCIDAAESYADVIREIRQEQEDNESYERCYYN